MQSRTFSRLDVFASTVTRKMRNSKFISQNNRHVLWNGLFDLQIAPMIHSSDHARVPSFFLSEQACMCACVRICARVSVSALAEACEWQPVSERDVIIWLMSVWAATAGRVTSLVPSWHCGQETLLYDFPTREETLLSQSALPLFDLIWGLFQYGRQIKKKKRECVCARWQ